MRVYEGREIEGKRTLMEAELIAGLGCPPRLGTTLGATKGEGAAEETRLASVVVVGGGIAFVTSGLETVGAETSFVVEVGGGGLVRPGGAAAVVAEVGVVVVVGVGAVALAAAAAAA